MSGPSQSASVGHKQQKIRVSDLDSPQHDARYVSDDFQTVIHRNHLETRAAKVTLQHSYDVSNSVQTARCFTLCKTSGCHGSVDCQFM